MARLRAIAEGLDRHHFPVVFDDGVVEPGTRLVNDHPPGKGSDQHDDGKQRARGPEARQREGTADREGEAGGSAAEGEGPTGEAPPVVGGGLLASPREVSEVRAAYPSLGVRRASDASWLLLRPGLIRGLPDRAILVLGIPDDGAADIRAWAWWEPGVWIGPRHTNWDGSICSHETRDSTWRRGDALVALVDLHVVWIVRHLHLRLLGRWPGRQVLHTAYERLTEIQVGELCGCGGGRLYDDCHRYLDRLLRDRPLALWSARKAHRAKRRPSAELVDFVFGVGPPPALPTREEAAG